MNVLSQKTAIKYPATLSPSEGYSTTDGLLSMTLTSYNGSRNVGVQSTVPASDKFNVRFSAVMDDYTQYEAAGFEFTYVAGPDTAKVGNMEPIACEYVYETILAEDEPVAASVYGGNYFFCFTIEGLTVGQQYSFEAKPYVSTDGTTKTYGSATTYTFVMNTDGTMSFVD